LGQGQGFAPYIVIYPWVTTTHLKRRHTEIKRQTVNNLTNDKRLPIPPPCQIFKRTFILSPTLTAPERAGVSETARELGGF